MVQTLVKPNNFQFHLIAGSKGASSPNVRGMYGERMDTKKCSPPGWGRKLPSE